MPTLPMQDLIRDDQRNRRWSLPVASDPYAATAQADSPAVAAGSFASAVVHQSGATARARR